MTDRSGSARAGKGEKSERELVDGVPRLLVLAKATLILDCFTVEEPELSIQDLAARTGLPASTCNRLVRNLAYLRLLERVGDRYRVGLAAVRWASAALESRDLVTSARAALDRLRDQTDESALLCVREGAFVVLLASADSHHAVVRRLRAGELVPLHAGSRGKVFLAFDPGALPAIKGIEYEKFTPRTTTELPVLLAQLNDIRQAGYAISSEERNIGAAGISAPVFDSTGHMVAAIGLMGPVARMSDPGQYADAVLHAAREVSQLLGFVPGPSGPLRPALPPRWALRVCSTGRTGCPSARCLAPA